MAWCLINYTKAQLYLYNYIGSCSPLLDVSKSQGDSSGVSPHDLMSQYSVAEVLAAIGVTCRCARNVGTGIGITLMFATHVLQASGEVDTSCDGLVSANGCLSMFEGAPSSES
jgi:hypothetical protein